MSQFDSSINSIYIALILKVDSHNFFFDYKPIGLCNFYYKKIVKTLANRLKKVLPKTISCSQSAFIPGKLIIDNILITHEALHIMRTMQKEREKSIALKLDMSKTYSRIE